MTNTVKKGKEGEEIAIQMLRKKGYKIRHTNWRFMHYEIDIVAENDEYLIIVEVKSRYSNYYEMPYNAVSNKKIRFLINATEAYIYKYDIQKETRFDIVSIVHNGKNSKTEHIEDAFRAML